MLVRYHHRQPSDASFYEEESLEFKKTRRRIPVILLEGARKHFFPFWPKGIEKLCFLLLITLALTRLSHNSTTSVSTTQFHFPNKISTSSYRRSVFPPSPPATPRRSVTATATSALKFFRKKKPKKMKKPTKSDPLDAMLSQRLSENIEVPIVDLGPSNHEPQEDGLVQLDVDGAGFARHIIFDLIFNATEKYQIQQWESPKSLEDATAIYHSAFDRPPPTHYDLIGPLSPSPPTALLPFHSLSSAALHSDQIAFEATAPEGKESIFILVSSNGRLSAEYPFGESSKLRAERLVEGLRLYEGVIGELRIAVDISGGSMPQLVPFEITDLRTRAALSHQVVGTSPTSASGAKPFSLDRVCASSSTFHQYITHDISLSTLQYFKKNPDYIHSPLAASDICSHPHLIALNPPLTQITTQETLIQTQQQARPVPVLAPWKLSVDSSILAPFIAISSQNETDTFSDEDEEPIPWHDKRGGRVATWRGVLPSLRAETSQDLQITPWLSGGNALAYGSTKWRLSLLKSLPLPPNFPRFAVPDLGKEEVGFEVEDAPGNAVWDETGILDIAASNKPMCHGVEGCQDLVNRIRVDTSTWKPSAHKFVLVVEDESPRKVFLGESVALHVGIAHQPWMEKAVPWYHYVPVQADFSDLPSIMLFFGKYPLLAQSIAKHGREFALEYMTYEQERKEFVGLLLEYCRIWNGREE